MITMILLVGANAAPIQISVAYKQTLRQSLEIVGRRLGDGQKTFKCLGNPTFIQDQLDMSWEELSIPDGQVVRFQVMHPDANAALDNLLSIETPVFPPLSVQNAELDAWVDQLPDIKPEHRIWLQSGHQETDFAMHLFLETRRAISSGELDLGETAEQINLLLSLGSDHSLTSNLLLTEIWKTCLQRHKYSMHSENAKQWNSFSPSDIFKVLTNKKYLEVLQKKCLLLSVAATLSADQAEGMLLGFTLEEVRSKWFAPTNGFSKLSGGLLTNVFRFLTSEEFAEFRGVSRNSTNVNETDEKAGPDALMGRLDVKPEHRIWLQSGYQETEFAKRLFEWTRRKAIFPGWLSLEGAMKQIDALLILGPDHSDTRDLLLTQIWRECTQYYIERLMEDDPEVDFTFSDLFKLLMSPSHLAALKETNVRVSDLATLSTGEADGVLAGFWLEDVKSAWFTPMHIKALSCGYTIEELRELNEEESRHLTAILRCFTPEQLRELSTQLDSEDIRFLILVMTTSNKGKSIMQAAGVLLDEAWAAFMQQYTIVEDEKSEASIDQLPDLKSEHLVWLQSGHQETEFAKQLFLWTQLAIFFGQLSLREAKEQIDDLLTLGTDHPSTSNLLLTQIFNRCSQKVKNTITVYSSNRDHWDSFSSSDLFKVMTSKNHFEILKERDVSVSDLVTLSATQANGLSRWFMFEAPWVKAPVAGKFSIKQLRELSEQEVQDFIAGLELVRKITSCTVPGWATNLAVKPIESGSLMGLTPFGLAILYQESALYAMKTACVLLDRAWSAFVREQMTQPIKLGPYTGKTLLSLLFELDLDEEIFAIAQEACGLQDLEWEAFVHQHISPTAADEQEELPRRPATPSQGGVFGSAGSRGSSDANDPVVAVAAASSFIQSGP